MKTIFSFFQNHFDLDTISVSITKTFGNHWFMLNFVHDFISLNSTFSFIAGEFNKRRLVSASGIYNFLMSSLF